MSVGSTVAAGVGVVAAQGLQPAADSTMVANISGGTAFPTNVTIASVLAYVGVPVYQGVWNASTNTPTLASSVGTNGYYYVVSVAGTTSLNGIADWSVGDWAIFNGTTSAWQKIEGGATTVTVGSTTISGGTTTRILYDNAGVLGEYTLTGTGTVVAMQTSPAFLVGATVGTVGAGTTPVFGTFGAVANPSTNGSGASGGLRVGSTSAAQALDVGVSNSAATGSSWLQSRSASDYATNLDLWLNPNGGNVSIGTTTTQSQTFYVNGTAAITTSLALGGATIGSNALAVTGASLFTGSMVFGGTSDVTGVHNISFSNYIQNLNGWALSYPSASVMSLQTSGQTTQVQLDFATQGVWKFKDHSGGQIFSAAAANLQLGAAAVDTAPVAQTLSVQNTLAGGTSNVAGADFTVGLSLGKGSGQGGRLLLSGYLTGVAGATTVNTALTTALTVPVADRLGIMGTAASLSLGPAGTGLSNDFALNYLNGSNSIQYRLARNGSGSDHVFGNSSNTMARIKWIATNGAAQIQLSEGISTPAGGTAGLGYTFGATANLGIFFGSGAPSLAAAQGSLYIRSDGSTIATRLYVNTDGSTTWTNFVSAA